MFTSYCVRWVGAFAITEVHRLQKSSDIFVDKEALLRLEEDQ